ncbi:disease resistance protein RPM1-like [Mercurialis annua]|uniref:disease resistance protein RPM1-like n=1 Tax=Mercurialis annua TaxID=3986 RepID=UPI00215E98EE|nr:disease resistance protein RPM1-like [Mercurialis annua]
MPRLRFYRETDDRREAYLADKSSRRASDTGKLRKLSCLSNFEKLFWKTNKYEKLPHHLKSCLDYISIMKYHKKHDLVRLMIAQGLIADKSGENMEDVAESIIDELVELGRLAENRYFDCLEVVVPYNNLCIVDVDEHKFLSKAEHLPSAKLDLDSDRGLSRAFMQDICKLQFLVVLRLFGAIESIPDEVGNLVNLKYLELAKCMNLFHLPRTLGNLQRLQTLKITYCGRLRELPVDMLKLQQLRHLLLSSGCVNNGEVRVPKGIGTLVNLQTCEGVYAGDSIAKELGTLTQLRRFGAKRVSEDHSSELAAAIMSMENLLSLSLQAEGACLVSEWIGRFLPELENFSPPRLVQKLTLSGTLIEIPKWVAPMEKLTKLTLTSSNLSQDEASLLQYLPKLKHLHLWGAYC